MSNWEKLLKREVYNDFSKDLFRRRLRAKELFIKYNTLDFSGEEEKNAILKDLLKKVGKNVWIEPHFRCEYGSNIEIGDDVYINFDSIILDCAPVVIKNRVLIGPRVGVYTANHSIDVGERRKGGCYGRPVTIENDVWIGGDVKILGGINIGSGSIIGTGSVVTKDIPEGVIAVGNPCKVLRNIVDMDKTGFIPEFD